MPRLFLGTYLSKDDQAALGKLAEHNSHLETEWNCRIKWSKPDQLHLTWIFFGNVETSKIDNLCLSMKNAVTSNPIKIDTNTNISLAFENLECWFSGKIPSLLALVPNTISTNFLNYATHLRTHLGDHAAPDVRQQAQRKFKPHITIARLAVPEKGKSRLEQSAIHGLTSILPLVQTIDTISLIQSTEQNGGHQYTIVENFGLE